MIRFPFEQGIRVIVNEAFVYRKAVVILFVLISMTFAVVGLVWPNTYKSSTTIIVDQKNIIQPLMEGAAVATTVTDRARIAREIIYGRNLLKKVMEETGQLESEHTGIELELLVESLKNRTKIVDVGKNLIKIEYEDSDPERALKTAEKLSELFISESLEAQAKESQSAFLFIEKQVEQYHTKLTTAEDELKEFRSLNLDARPGTEAEVGARISTLQERIEKASQDLKEAEIRKSSIEKQLFGEAEITGSLSREGQYRIRMNELQAELDTLRLNYHDTYPDIVRLRHQIDDLSRAILSEKEKRESGEYSGKTKPNEVDRQSIFLNPLYQNLRRELSETKTNIETLSARLKDNKRLMAVELKRGRRVHVGEAKLAELTRDYEVNRDIYRDLLRRRENARVSMNLDLTRQGMSLRVYQPAFLPLRTSGLRFIHFLLGGMLLGVSVPIMFLYFVFRFDPRVRIESIISDEMGLPVLSVIPHLTTPMEDQAISRDAVRLGAIVLSTITIALLVGLLRLQGVV